MSNTSQNRFNRKTTSNEPFVGPDGTLIFQHPTIPNYYENSDQPQLKGNPYSNIMWNPHYHDPYYYNKGVPIVPGAVPFEKWKGNSIKREKRIMAKLTDSQEPGSPMYRGVDSDVQGSPRYVYPSITDNVTGSTLSKKPWAAGYYNGWGGWPHGYGGRYGYGRYGYHGAYGYGNNFGYGGWPYGGYGGWGRGWGHGYGRYGYGHHPWSHGYGMGMHNMGKKNWRALHQPPEPVDPVYKYLDPISVSLQERVKRAGHILGEVETPLEKPVKYLFELKVLGDPNLSANPAAKISAEIEKH